MTECKSIATIQRCQRFMSEKDISKSLHTASVIKYGCTNTQVVNSVSVKRATTKLPTFRALLGASTHRVWGDKEPIIMKRRCIHLMSNSKYAGWCITETSEPSLTWRGSLNSDGLIVFLIPAARCQAWSYFSVVVWLCVAGVDLEEGTGFRIRACPLL